MRRRVTTWTLAAALLAVAPMPGSEADAQGIARAPSHLEVPIAGAVDGVAGTLSGRFAVSRLARSNNHLLAVGTLSATVSDATGTVERTIVVPLGLPITATAAPRPSLAASTGATCPILHVELGPVDLDLLGLVTRLDGAVLDISTEAAANTALGNLQCTIGNLLNRRGSQSSQNQVVNLMNQLLDALGNP